MKKLILLFTIFLVGFSIVACSQQPTEDKAQTPTEKTKESIGENQFYNNLTKQFAKRGIEFSEEQQADIKKLSEKQMEKLDADLKNAKEENKGEISQEKRQEITRANVKAMRMAVLSDIMTREQQRDMRHAAKKKEENGMN